MPEVLCVCPQLAKLCLQLSAVVFLIQIQQRIKKLEKVSLCVKPSIPTHCHNTE